METGFLYEILNTINQKRYVGITFKDPNKRWINHKSKARLQFKSPLYNSMNKYGIEFFKFEVLHENIPEHLLFMLEKFWIKELNLQDREFGYNLADGGNINRGFKHSEEFKNQQSIRYLGEKAPFYGRRHTEESKSKVSIANTGRKHTPEERIKMSESHMGEKSRLYGVTGENHPMYGFKMKKESIQAIKNNMPHKQQVNMLEKTNGELIKQFDSFKDAARWINDNTDSKNNNLRSISGVIGRVCSGERKTAYGFKWEYKIN